MLDLICRDKESFNTFKASFIEGTYSSFNLRNAKLIPSEGSVFPSLVVGDASYEISSKAAFSSLLKTACLSNSILKADEIIPEGSVNIYNAVADVFNQADQDLVINFKFGIDLTALGFWAEHVTAMMIHNSFEKIQPMLDRCSDFRAYLSDEAVRYVFLFSDTDSELDIGGSYRMGFSFDFSSVAFSPMALRPYFFNNDLNLGFESPAKLEKTATPSKIFGIMNHYSENPMQLFDQFNVQLFELIKSHKDFTISYKDVEGGYYGLRSIDGTLAENLLEDFNFSRYLAERNMPFPCRKSSFWKLTFDVEIPSYDFYEKYLSYSSRVGDTVELNLKIQKKVGTFFFTPPIYSQKFEPVTVSVVEEEEADE